MKYIKLDKEGFDHDAYINGFSTYTNIKECNEMIYEMIGVKHHRSDLFEFYTVKAIVKIHKEYELSEIYEFSEIDNEQDILKTFFQNFLGEYPDLNFEQQVTLAWL